MTAKFDVFEDGEGLYRFQLTAANGVPLADSRPYATIAEVRHGMAAAQRAATEAEVPTDDEHVVIQSGIHMHFIALPPK